jgi:hypothetical protein
MKSIGEMIKEEFMLRCFRAKLRKTASATPPAFRLGRCVAGREARNIVPWRLGIAGLIVFELAPCYCRWYARLVFRYH